MSTAGFVLVCALDLLGRSANQLPPIVIVEQRPPEASLNAVGFVRRGEHVIYLVASAPVFRTAVEAQDGSRECRGLDALRFIASIIVHEEWHLKHGSDEEGAYYAQLTELQRLGAGPGRWPYNSVKRAMTVALEDESRRLSLARRQLALGSQAGR
jgi:23S rRNA C2498 (ribose-2'-O)-methylase RlmM